MQMTLTITAESPAEMVTVLKALQVSGVDTPVQIKAKEEPMIENPPRPRGRPPRRDTAVNIPEEPPAAPEPVVEPKAKLTVVPKEKQAEQDKKDITIMDVRKALTEYLAANDESAAAKLLAKHGKTDRLSKLEPQYLEAVYYAAVTPAVKAEFDDDISTVGSA